MSEGAKLVLDADSTGLLKGQAALHQTAVAAAQAERAVTRNAAATAKASSAMGALGNMSTATKGKVMSFGQQLQGVAIQAQMGTSAFTIAAQQGSQFLSVFGPMGAVLGAVAAIGLPIAGAAFASMGGSAKSAAETLDEFSDSAAKALDATKQAKAPISELAKEYGGLAQEAKKALDAQAAFQRATSIEKMVAAQAAIAAAFNYDESFAGTAAAIQGLSDQMQDLANQYDLSGEAINGLIPLMNAMSAAKGPNEVLAATVALRDALIAAGVDGVNPLIGQLNTAEQAALDLAAAAPSGAWMDGPIDGVRRLAAETAAARAQIAALNKANAASAKVYSGRGEDPRKFMAGAALSYSEAAKPFEAVAAAAAKSSKSAAASAKEAAKETKSAWQSAAESIVDYLANGFERGFAGIVDIGVKAAAQVGAAWAKQKLFGTGSAGGGGLLGSIFGGGAAPVVAQAPVATPAAGGGLAAMAGPLAFGFSILGGLFGAARRRREAEERKQEAIKAQAAALEVRLLMAQGKGQEALAAQRKIELKALDKSNRATQKRIWQLEDEARVSAERDNLQVRLLELQGRGQEALALQRSIEIKSVDEANRALQERIWKLEDEARITGERTNLQIRLLELQGKESEALALRRQMELAATDESNRAILQRIYALEDEAKAAENAKAKIDELLGKINEDNYANAFDYRLALAQASVGIVPQSGSISPMQTGAAASVSTATQIASLRAQYDSMALLLSQIAINTAKAARASEELLDETIGAAA